MSNEPNVAFIRSVQTERKPPFFMNLYFDAQWVMHPGIGQYSTLEEAKKFASGKHLRKRLPVALHVHVDESGQVSTTS